VIFSYEDETGLSLMRLETLQKATLFIFDGSDNYVDSWTVDQERPELNKLYEPEDIKLYPGEYHFVVWFDLISPYSLFSTVDVSFSNKTRKDHAAVHLEIPDTRTIDTPLPLLLYGHKEEAIKAEGDNIIVIPLVQNTNTINIMVSGLPRTDDEYLFSIEDTNGNYNFYDEFAFCEPFSYINVENFSAESDTLKGSLTVLKLNKDRHPVLTIQNQSTREQIFPREGDEVGVNDLIALILREYPNNDFDKVHIYNIRISIDETNVTVTVDVDGWTEKPSDNEIVPD
jgi:hypothetical protein